jgi:hypothetical protein
MKKSEKFSLKGGIILSSLFVIFITSLAILTILGITNAAVILFFLAVPMLLMQIDLYSLPSVLYGLVIYIAIIFIIGAFIGLIYGRFANKDINSNIVGYE